jgi:hypothetical protein
VSDIGSEAAAGGAAAPLLAGCDRLVSTGCIEVRVAVRAVALRAPALSRALLLGGQKCSLLKNESGPLPAPLDPAGWRSPIARRKVA